MLESEHPGAIHEIRDVHSLELETIDVVHPVIIASIGDRDVACRPNEAWIVHQVVLSDGCENVLAVVIKVDGLTNLRRDQSVHDQCSDPNCDGESEVSGRGGLAPSFELESMRPEQAEILVWVREAEPLLKVVPAVIIVEHELMRRGSGEYRRIDVELTIPDVPDYLLSVRVLKQLDDAVVVNHVEAVAEVDILLEQQVCHLILIVDSLDVLFGNLENTLSNLLDSAVEEAKLRPDALDQLDQEAGGLDDVQSQDENVASRLAPHRLLYSRQKGHCLLVGHVLDEPLEQEALRLQHAVAFCEGIDQ